MTGIETAITYAEHLITDLKKQIGEEASGRDIIIPTRQELEAAAQKFILDPHQTAWFKSGLHELTVSKTQIFPHDLTSVANGVLLALQACQPMALLPKNGISLLGERARLMGLKARTNISANGSCYLFAAKDGEFALSLARHEDFELLPALTFGAFADDITDDEIDAQTISKLANIFKNIALDEIMKQGIDCGLPIARLKSHEHVKKNWCSLQHTPPDHTRVTPQQPPLVLDFSSLWAGPLASSLLAKLGARVIKIESRHRPDGARQGHKEFYDLLNSCKQSLAIDFTDKEDMRLLTNLIGQADIIIEASRPRALKQLGIDADKILSHQPNKTWLSLTAYGRHDAQALRVGFGDDIGIEGGLAYAMQHHTQSSSFVGDALPDPLTGLHAALAAYVVFQNGGGLIDMPMVGVMSHALSYAIKHQKNNFGAAYISKKPSPPYPLRPLTHPAAALDADRKKITAEFKGKTHAH